MENLGLGLMLMVVGMVTVFLILLIVILGSRLLIAAANKLAPEAVAAAAGPDASTRRVLEAAVAQLTGGKGKITNITKITTN